MRAWCYWSTPRRPQLLGWRIAVAAILLAVVAGRLVQAVTHAF